LDKVFNIGLHEWLDWNLSYMQTCVSILMIGHFIFGVVNLFQAVISISRSPVSKSMISILVSCNIWNLCESTKITKDHQIDFVFWLLEFLSFATVIHRAGFSHACKYDIPFSMKLLLNYKVNKDSANHSKEC